jgi:hypothetical protein
MFSFLIAEILPLSPHLVEVSMFDRTTNKTFIGLGFCIVGFTLLLMENSHLALGGMVLSFIGTFISLKDGRGV